MGLAATFNAIQRFDADDAAPLILAALDEPDDTLRSFAAAALIDRKFADRIDELFRRFPSLSPAVRKAALEKRWLLVPIAKAAMGYGTPAAKEALFGALPFLPENDAIIILSGGLSDPSEQARTRVLGLMETRMRDFVERRRRAAPAEAYAGMPQEEAEMIPHIAEALSAIIAAYDEHQRDLFLDAAVECGDAAYTIVTTIALTKAYTPVYTTLQKTLVAADTEAATRILLRLSQEKEERLHGLAVEVFRRKTGGRFIPVFAAVLRGMDATAFGETARRFQQIPWWKLLVDFDEIDPESAGIFINFILESGLDAGEKPEKVRRFLSAGDPAVRMLAFGMLRRMNAKGLVDDCRKLLADPDEDLVLAVVAAVIEMNFPEKVKLLTPLLHSSSGRVMKAVVSAMSRDSFQRYMNSFDALDERTRELAAKAIAKLDAGVTERLAEEITALDPERRVKAIRIIDFLDKEQEMGKELLNVIADPDRKVRATAIKMLGIAGNTRAIKSLIGSLNDPDRRVRANAIEAFEDIGDPRFAQLLMPFTRDPDNRVRANSVKALWHLGVTGVREIIEGMLASDEVNMRLSAVWVIGEIEFPEGKNLLARLFRTETDEKVRAKIREVLKENEGA